LLHVQLCSGQYKLDTGYKTKLFLFANAILDRTLRNTLDKLPTATNSTANVATPTVGNLELSVSQEPVKDKPLQAVAALQNTE
jgi:hypothetical protein